jgi:hypothetical protein
MAWQSQRRKRDSTGKLPFGSSEEERRRRAAFAAYYRAKLGNIAPRTHEEMADYYDEPVDNDSSTSGAR